MYENIKYVTEVCRTDEANRLLSEGWKLLDIYHAERYNCKWRDYIMGKAEPDAAQCAIDENQPPTKETPRLPIPTDADEPEAALDHETRLRMIAEAVSGMTYRDWCQTSQKVHQMFTTSVNAVRNRTVIDRPPDEIADIIVKQEW